MKTKLQIITIGILLANTMLLSNSLLAQNFWEKIDLPDCGYIKDLLVDKNNNLYISTQYGLFLQKDGSSEITLLSEKFFPKLFCWNDLPYGAYENVYRLNPQMNSIDSVGTFPRGVLDVLSSHDGSIYFAGPSYIIKSSNLSQPWDTVCNSDSLGTVYSLTEDSDGVLYAGTIDYFNELGGVFHSTNGGNKWQHIGLSRHGITSLATTKNNELLVGFYTDSLGNGGMYKYNKESNNWTKLLYGYKEVKTIVVDSNNTTYISNTNLLDTNMIIEKSMDECLSWTDYSKGLNEEVHTMYLGNDNYLYAINQLKHAGTFYGGIYRSAAPVYVGINNNKEHNNINAYPNPFHNSFTIEQHNQQGYLYIYNSSGKQVYAAKLTKNKRALINIPWLPKGIYLLKFISNNKMYASKIVKN